MTLVPSPSVISAWDGKTRSTGCMSCDRHRQCEEFEMRCLVQRVSQAKVEVAGRTLGEIGQGLVILVCAMRGDTETNVQQLAKKAVNLRIFADDAGKMNKSLQRLTMAKLGEIGIFRGAHKWLGKRDRCHGLLFRDADQLLCATLNLLRRIVCWTSDRNCIRIFQWAARAGRSMGERKSHESTGSL
jgi:hypothetical protein